MFDNPDVYVQRMFAAHGEQAPECLSAWDQIECEKCGSAEDEERMVGWGVSGVGCSCRADVFGCRGGWFGGRGPWVGFRVSVLRLWVSGFGFRV